MSHLRHIIHKVLDPSAWDSPPTGKATCDVIGHDEQGDILCIRDVGTTIYCHEWLWGAMQNLVADSK